jgi:hypothetical protein
MKFYLKSRITRKDGTQDIYDASSTDLQFVLDKFDTIVSELIDMPPVRCNVFIQVGEEPKVYAAYSRNLCNL